MVIDTHIFLWYILGDPRIPPSLRERMDASPQDAYLPSICLWELMVLLQKGRIELGWGDPSSRLREFLRDSNFTEAPLTSEIALLSRELPFKRDDPADRFIVATAKVYGMPLATLDEQLRNLPWIALAE